MTYKYYTRKIRGPDDKEGNPTWVEQRKRRKGRGKGKGWSKPGWKSG